MIMKKILTAFVLFSGIFTVSAQEVTPLTTIQQEKNNLRTYAENDATFVDSKLELNGENYGVLVQVFYNKYKMLTNENDETAITEIATMTTNRLKEVLTIEKYSELAEIEGAIEKLSGLIYLNQH